VKHIPHLHKKKAKGHTYYYFDVGRDPPASASSSAFPMSATAISHPPCLPPRA
jgi:hypothetical protein